MQNNPTPNTAETFGQNAVKERYFDNPKNRDNYPPTPSTDRVEALRWKAKYHRLKYEYEALLQAYDSDTQRWQNESKANKS